MPQSKLPDKRIFALCNYEDDLVKKLIWNLKYKNLRAVGGILGRELAHNLPEEWRGRGVIYVVPIPLARSRKRERGYNQAEVIARAMVNNDPASYRLAAKWLVKVKDTPSQVSLKSRAARLKNLRGAFALGKSAREIRGKTILLVDDVVTTGGTLNEARSILNQAGARRVHAAALAHG